MKTDINLDVVRSNKLELLDCQVEIILRSLEFYIYTFEFANSHSSTYKSKEEDLTMSLIKDTYSQINLQFVKSKKAQPIDSDIEEKLEKIRKLA